MLPGIRIGRRWTAVVDEHYFEVLLIHHRNPTHGKIHNRNESSREDDLFHRVMVSIVAYWQNMSSILVIFGLFVDKII